MSYAVKYRITQATQAGPTITVDMLEDGYVGDVIQYLATYITLDYIPASDDAFEPIYASQLSVGINVTPDLGNMPNFTTLDDRKYLCKQYADGVLEWQGWALSDSVRFAFTTGIKELQFNAICGLGMLNNIDFVYDYDSFFALTGSLTNLISLICISLRQIGFPTGLNVFTSCNIYATGMTDPGDGSYLSVFGQAYTPFTSTQTNGVNRKSIDILKDILVSFGCRILQAKGKWCILQINQMALDDPYYYEYSEFAVTRGSGQFSDAKHFPTDLYFLYNNQIKILRKGYNNIISENTIIYPSNYIFNFDLKENDGTDATGWVRTTANTGTAIIGQNVGSKYNTWILNLPNATIDFAQVEITILPYVAKNEEIKLSWYFYGGVFANVSGHACKMILTISSGVATYYLDTDGDWQLASGPIFNYFGVPDDEISQDGSTPYNLTVKPAPISGSLSFGLRLNQDTGTSMTVGGFKMTVDSPFKSVTVTSRINNSNEYTLKVSLPFGLLGPQDGKFYWVGALSQSDGTNWQTWYNYERKGSQQFRSLTELTMQNLVNHYRSNLINLEATLKGMGLSDNRTNALTRFSFNDTDPEQINVQDYKYLIGNTSINFQQDEISLTLLKVSDENIDAQIEVTYEDNQDTGSTTIGRRLGVNATLNKPDACALNYGTQFLYFVDSTYNVGDTVYNSNTLSTPFNGASLWWKVEIQELNQSRAMRISASGIIMDIQTC